MRTSQLGLVSLASALLFATACEEGATATATAQQPDASAAGELPVPFDCPSDSFGLQRVAVNGVTLRVACRGRAGPVLLLLHGYPEFYLAWNQLADRLVAAGYRVIAPDQRGHGMSDRPADVSSYDISVLVEDVRALIGLTAQERVLVVGHDWGGTVAWVLAHRHPELLRGLVVLDAPHPDLWRNAELDPVQARASEGYIPLLAGPLGGGALTMIEPMLAPHLSPDELAAYREVWKQPEAVASMNKWYQANVHPTYTLPRGVTVDTPTLALWGEADIFVTSSQLTHLPRYVPQLKVKTFPGVDHWITHQVTDELFESIRTFERGL
jgi:epoxide hydrolase 4